MVPIRFQGILSKPTPKMSRILSVCPSCRVWSHKSSLIGPVMLFSRLLDYKSSTVAPHHLDVNDPWCSNPPALYLFYHIFPWGAVIYIIRHHSKCHSALWSKALLCSIRRIPPLIFLPSQENYISLYTHTHTHSTSCFNWFAQNLLYVCEGNVNFIFEDNSYQHFQALYFANIL